MRAVCAVLSMERVALGGTGQCGEHAEYTNALFASDHARDATKATSTLQGF